VFKRLSLKKSVAKIRKSATNGVVTHEHSEPQRQVPRKIELRFHPVCGPPRTRCVFCTQSALHIYDNTMT
jgi:hypothetical protein